MTDASFRFEIDRVKSHASRAEIIASLREYGRLHQSKSSACASMTTGRIVYSHLILSGDSLEAGPRRFRKQDLGPYVDRRLIPQQWSRRFERAAKNNTQSHHSGNLRPSLSARDTPFRIKTYGTFFGGVGRLVKLIVQVQNGELSEGDLLRRVECKGPICPPISRKLRYAILKRDHEQCVKCGDSPKKNSEVTLEVDHIIPVAKGGTNDPTNLQMLCWSCNQGRNRCAKLNSTIRDAGHGRKFGVCRLAPWSRYHSMDRQALRRTWLGLNRT